MIRHADQRSCPGSRACNPARSLTSQYTSTRACVLNTNDTQVPTPLHLRTLKAHSSTLNYTRYGYVKPIDFVNCVKKDCFETKTMIRPTDNIFTRVAQRRIADPSGKAHRISVSLARRRRVPLAVAPCGKEKPVFDRFEKRKRKLFSWLI